MTNPINVNNSPAERVLGQPTRERAPAAAPTGSNPVAAPTDTVSLTSAELLSASGGEVDVETVTRIRQQIQAGRYDLDPESIAQKLLAFEGDLVRRS